MAEKVDLSNPDFEPSDAQLMELSVRAFAGVRAQRENALRELRAKIAEERRAALQSLEASMSSRVRP